MNRQFTTILATFFSLVFIPSVSFGDIFRCSPIRSEQAFQRDYAHAISPIYIIGDVLIEIEGDDVKFINYESAIIHKGFVTNFGKTNIKCDTDYSHMEQSLECWNNLKNEYNYLKNIGKAFLIAKIRFGLNNFDRSTLVDRVKSGKWIELSVSRFHLRTDENGLLSYDGDHTYFGILSCR